MKILKSNEYYYFNRKEMLSESLSNLSKNESDFGKYLRTNTPMIYAFITKDIPDAIKVGYTNQGVQNRIDQWKKKYNDITVLGQWTATEINQLGEKVFFMDYPVHAKIEGRGYANVKPDDKRFHQVENIHVSKEFFNKYKDITRNEADALSDKIIGDIMAELKNDIRNNKSAINLYKFIFDGSKALAGKAMGAPNTFSPTPLQTDCINAATNAIQHGKTDLLMAAVMRFGKTAATYWIIKNNNIKYAVVTSAKADTREAWRNDINHVDFIDDFCFIEFDGNHSLAVSEKDENSGRIHTEFYQDPDLIDKKRKEGKTVIIYATLQDLSGKHDKLDASLGVKQEKTDRKIKDKHRYIFENKPELIVIDETHYGSHSNIYGKATGLAKDYMDYDDVKKEMQKESKDRQKLDEYTRSIDAEIRLQCSGTPYYILASGEFGDNYAHKEIISDVSLSDMIESRDKWVEEHPGQDESESPYFGIPNIYKFGMKLTKKCMSAIKKSDENTAMHVLFENDGNEFRHKDAVIDLMENIFGANSKKMPGWLNEDKIKNGEIFKHMVMVLPHINDCNLMRDLLVDENIVNTKEREIIIAVERRSKRSTGGFGLEAAAKDSDALNTRLEELEEQGKHSLTITVNRFLTGVSIPLWDSMLYMKDTRSPQEYDQNIMRLCTRCVGKAKDSSGKEIKMCKKANVYVVDFKIDRMFEMVNSTANAQILASKKEWSKDLFEKIVKRMLKTTPLYSVPKDSVYTTNTDTIVSGMHELSVDDLLKKYINYNRTKSIEETININDFSHFYSNVGNAALLKSFSANELNSAKEIMNVEGEDSPELQLTKSGTQKNTASDSGNKPGKNPVAEDNKARLANMIKRILYSAMCMGMENEINTIHDYLDLVKNDKECKKTFTSFKMNEKTVNDIVSTMTSGERRMLSFYLSQLNYITKDKTMSPAERVQTCMAKLGKLDKSEVITPKTIVKKMIAKLDRSDFEKADSILEVNSKNGEFVTEIYEQYGKKVANKVKIVASSSMTKQFIRLVLRTLGLDEKNLIEIDNTDNYNIKDFLDTDMTKENKGKKFDICLMNPPYGGTLHLKFLEKVIDISKNVISIQPIIWLFGQNDLSKQLDKINTIKENINTYESSIEKINQQHFGDAAIGQDTGIIHINKEVKNTKTDVTYNDKKYTTDNIYDIKKYGDDKLLHELEKTLKPIYEKDNFFNHLVFGPRSKGHLGKKKNEERIDFNPNVENFIVNMPQMRGHVNSDDFYTACEKQLKPVKYKDYYKGKKTPWSYIVCDNKTYCEHIINYLKTDFVRSCLYFNKFSTFFITHVIPWFDFTDEHFSKSPREIDDWLFKKYGISDEIRKHIEEILPDYYGIR